MSDKITHRFLVDKGAYWLNKQASNVFYRSQYVLTEFSCQGVNEYPDIFGIRPYGHVLIEVKVSRADFKKDEKKRGRDPRFKQLGDSRFYLAPKGMISVEELPEKWGLLEWNGNRIEVTKESESFDGCDKAAGFVMYSVIRRLHKQQIFDFKENPAVHILTKSTDLPQRVKNIMSAVDLDTLGEIAEYGEKEIRRFRNVGDDTIKSIKKVLRKHKLKLKK